MIRRVILILCLFFICMSIASADTVYRQQLTIPTYDHSNELTHPDVWYNESGWHGYKYWMVITPYPNGDDSTENPSVVVSNNGYDWTTHKNIANPIEAYSTIQFDGHYSDTDLIYNPASDELYIYWRFNNDTDEAIYMKKYNGTRLSNTYTILTNNREELLSPAIIRENSTYWYMWTVNNSANGNNSIRYYNSTDGITFSYRNNIVVDKPDGKDIWHINVIPADNYHTYHGLFTYCDSGSNGGGCELYYANSSNHLNWTLQPRVLIDRREGKWDSDNVYRSAGVLNGDKIRIWYSAAAYRASTLKIPFKIPFFHIGSEKRVWRIGYAEAGYKNGNWTLLDLNYTKSPPRNDLSTFLGCMDGLKGRRIMHVQYSLEESVSGALS